MNANARPLRLVTDDDRDQTPPTADDGAVVDEWGASRLAVSAARALGALRWRVLLTQALELPADRGALLVTNPRPLAMVPPMVALAVGERLGRTVRFAGAADVAPVGPLLRRAGAVLDLADEVASALRGGEVVVVGAGDAASGFARVASWLGAAHARPQSAGAVPVDHIAAAIGAGVPVHPVAVAGAPGRRTVHAAVLPAVSAAPRRAAPDPHVLAERVRERLQARLDEFAGRP